MTKSLTPLLGLALLLTGCYGVDDDWSSDDDSGGGSADSSYSYSYTCPDTNTSHTIEIPSRTCGSEYEFFAYSFGCNLVGNMDSAACQLQSCTGENFACGAYAQP